MRSSSEEDAADNSVVRWVLWCLERSNGDVGANDWDFAAIHRAVIFDNDFIAVF
jgi:hypothetical protein